MLFEAFADERRQHFIDAVDGGAAVNMAGDLGDDLRRHRGGGRDRLRRLDLRVAILKPWVSMPFRSISMQLNIGKKGE